jgi:phenylalanyl-tRNA synthetase alpha chain
MSAEEKKTFGAEVNALKQDVTQAIEARRATLSEAAIAEKLQTEWLDVTLPPRPERGGTVHPVTQVIEEITAIFADMGFSVATGPEIEDDYHNFTALNFPEHHPAREMHDTFFLKVASSELRVPSREHSQPATGNSQLLRTHTSPVQIRTMRAGKPPFRFIAPGKTYRHDSDQTHTPMFHQVEGFVIDKGIHMGHLKGVIELFLKRFFALDAVPLRFRPSFFPFTEPSAEVDIGCARGKDAIVIGAGADWLEVMGCGMVHPNVLKNCGIDPNEWQGFAFGMGVERLATLKYGMPDLRDFFESDIRWLTHYGFAPLDIPGDVL